MVLCGLFITSAHAQNLIGSYHVSDGLNWQNDNPPTYSCLEACAEVFDGDSADYACSTSDSSINHQAFVSTWGVAGCSIEAEAAKLGTDYNCGEGGCAFSAYVDDNCKDASAINYCYAAPLSEAVNAEPVPVMSGLAISVLSLLVLLAAAFGFNSAFRKVR